METQLRKYQNTLRITSMGIVSFALWSAIKAIMYFVTSAEMFRELSKEVVFEGISSTFLLNFFYCMVAVILISDVLMRVFVCSGAIGEAKGKKKGYGYMIVGTYLFVSSLTMLVQNIFTFYSVTTSVFDTIISMVIEISSIYTLGELLFSAFKVKMLKRKIR